MRELGKSFWTFLFAENLYDFGLYIFVLLYNLYLLDLGYREDFLGWVTSAMTAGSIIGALPAAAITRRLGLKRTVMLASAGVAILCAIRVAPSGGPALIASAFVMGVISSVWAVSLVPVVAVLTSERNRALGYSLWTGWGVGLGVLCGAVAGELPGWILRTGWVAGDRGAKQAALLLGAGVALLSPLLLIRLRFGPSTSAEPKIFPRSPFVTRYLAAFAVWNLAVGAFNPFFTAYFSRQLHMPVTQIGVVFSVAQLATLGALFVAPAMLRKLGVVTGIACTQLGVAVSLALLALGPPGLAAGALYAAFMSFQYMSEPGTFTLLMSRVEPHQRAGVSSLNFFVMSAAQALSAAVAGVGVTHFGYRIVLGSAAGVAALAAFLFRELLSSSEATEIPHTPEMERPAYPPSP